MPFGPHRRPGFGFHPLPSRVYTKGIRPWLLNDHDIYVLRFFAGEHIEVHGTNILPTLVGVGH
jgi:hypothetical protein